MILHTDGTAEVLYSKGQCVFSHQGCFLALGSM